MKISLRQLAVFDAVAKHGSVTKAAEVLGISQSAASASLKELQLTLKRPPLFRKAGRSLKLTFEGKRLQPKVRALLKDAQELELPSCSQDISGILPIAATETIGNYILPPLAAAFRRRYPGIRIDIHVGSAVETVELCNSLTVETGFIDHITLSSGLFMTECGSHVSYLTAASHHYLAGRNGLSVRDIEQAEWCIPHRYSAFGNKLVQVLDGKVNNMKVAIDCSSPESMRSAIKAGAGIGFLPLKMIEDDLQRGDLVRLDVPGMSFRQAIHLLRPRDIKRGAAATAFDDFVLGHYGTGPAVEPAQSAVAILSGEPI